MFFRKGSCLDVAYKPAYILTNKLTHVLRFLHRYDINYLYLSGVKANKFKSVGSTFTRLVNKFTSLEHNAFIPCRHIMVFKFECIIVDKPEQKDGAGAPGMGGDFDY